jgi:hypothetical protein
MFSAEHGGWTSPEHASNLSVELLSNTGDKNGCITDKTYHNYRGFNGLLSWLPEEISCGLGELCTGNSHNKHRRHDFMEHVHERCLQ